MNATKMEPTGRILERPSERSNSGGNRRGLQQADWRLTPTLVAEFDMKVPDGSREPENGPHAVGLFGAPEKHAFDIPTACMRFIFSYPSSKLRRDHWPAARLAGEQSTPAQDLDAKAAVYSWRLKQQRQRQRHTPLNPLAEYGSFNCGGEALSDAAELLSDCADRGWTAGSSAAGAAAASN